MPFFHSRPHPTKLAILLSATGACIALLILAVFRPSFNHATYLVGNDGEETPFTMPLSITTGENVEVHVSLTMHVPVGMTRLRFIPDDCLQSLTVNGQMVGGNELPFCDYSKGRMLDLSDVVKPGENSIQAIVKNAGGPAAFTIKPALGAGLRVAALVLLGFAGCAMALTILRRFCDASAWPSMAVVTAGSIAVRLAYMAQTDYSVRGYDTDGHIEYIRYILAHWSVPPATEGWQFYQPPLYYLLAALPAGIGNVVGDGTTGLLFVQILSFVLSTLSVLVGCWIVLQLFPKKAQLPVATLSFALFAFFPGSVFLASRINNDVLFEFLGLLCIGTLIRWWFDRSESWWYLCIVTFAFALLTKSNALLLAPVIGLCLLVKPGLRIVPRIRLGSIALVVLLLLNAWYVALRAIEGQSGIVANLGNLNSALRLQTTWPNMTEFNPLRIVLQPYNNPWSDEAGRQFFWEYLFRSGFTGEFSFGSVLAPFLSVVLLLALLLLGSAMIGGWQAIRTRGLELLPIWLLPIVLLLGHAAYRQFVAPYGSSQDFRYSVLVILPLAILAVQGLAYLPFAQSRWPHVIAWSFVSSCAIFLLSVGAA